MKNSPETLKKRNKLKRKWKLNTDINSFPHEILRVCKDCGKNKLCKWLSSFTQTGKPEYRSRCNDCHSIKEKEWRKNSQKRISENAKARRLKRKQKCIDYLGGKCSQCGYSKCSRALTFHHHGNEKTKEISQMIDWSWSKVKIELNKCTLLCFNCHMEEHYEKG